jgi:hypothetical protein
VVIENRVQQIIQRFKQGGAVKQVPEIERVWTYDNFKCKGELLRAY